MNILLNQYVIIFLRFAHVAGGVLWVGGGVVLFYLLMPAVRSAESAGQAVMQKFGPRFGKYMGIVTTLTVVSGALLYSRFFIGQGAGWIWSTAPGLGLTIGSLAALASYIMGTSVFGPTQEKIGILGAEMAAAGRPSAEQISKMNQLQSFITKAYKLDMVLLAVAVGAMAGARYL